MWVLIIISYLAGGQTIQTQEFNTSLSCKKARTIVEKNSRNIGIVWIGCVKK